MEQIKRPADDGKALRFLAGAGGVQDRSSSCP